MVQSTNRGGLDVPALKAILEEVALGELNVQAVVLQPRGRTIDLAVSGRPAARGPWLRLDLSRRLSR
jgi:hypothetical protein